MRDIFDELLEEQSEGDIFDTLVKERDDDNFSKEMTTIDSQGKDTQRERLAPFLQMIQSIEKEEQQEKVSKITALIRSSIKKEVGDFRKLIKTEAAKLKPIETTIVKPVDRIVKEVIHQHVPVTIPPPQIQQIKEIIKEIRIEAPKDDKEYAEVKTVDDLKKQIDDLKKELEASRKNTALVLAARGGSGVIGIPPPEPNPVNYVLTINSDRKAQWKASQGGSGGGLTPGTFTINNNTPSYTFDATGDTIDNLYQIVATLVRKLQGEI